MLTTPANGNMYVGIVNNALIVWTGPVFMSCTASNGRSGKSQPPTRRQVTLINRFGEKASIKLSLAYGRMPGMPGNININAR